MLYNVITAFPFQQEASENGFNTENVYATGKNTAVNLHTDDASVLLFQIAKKT